MTKTDSCWMLPKGVPCFVQLGRAGDLIQMLPAFKAIHDRTGENPIVVVSRDYANVFDGVSYVDRWEVNLPWSQGVAQARGMAELKYPWVVALQFWNDSKDQFASEVTRQARMLQCHGEKWCVDAEKWPDYGTAMWSLAGFSRDDMLTLPLVFDRRDLRREAELARRCLHPTRPNLLFNWTGISSPFPYTPEFQQVLARYWKQFNFVDLGTIRAERIYDLLGLYDRAVGLITADTATLHLAPASLIPYIAFTRRDWSGSAPKGNCALDIGYNDATNHMADFERVLKSWLSIRGPKTDAPVVSDRGGGVAVFR